MLKTEQIMLRNFEGAKIPQRTSDKFFNATEMIKYYNNLTGSKKVFAEFLSNNNTNEFIEALRQEILNVGDSLHLQVIESKRGKNGATWMHPYLFVKFCFWLSPQFEVKVIKWVYDNLIDFRHDAGDFYKEMCKAISETYHDWYGKNPDPLIFIKEAHFLNYLCFGTQKGKQRNEATEKQLLLMNRLQKLNISLIYSKTGKDIRYKKLSEFAEMIKLSE
jgi:hypothetical protein